MLSLAPGYREAWATEGRVNAGVRQPTPWTPHYVGQAMQRFQAATATAVLLSQVVLTATSIALPRAPIFEGRAALEHHAERVEPPRDASGNGVPGLAAALLPSALGAAAGTFWVRRERRRLGLRMDGSPELALARVAWEHKAGVVRMSERNQSMEQASADPSGSTTFSMDADVRLVREQNYLLSLSDLGAGRFAMTPEKALRALDAARVVTARQDRVRNLAAPTIVTGVSTLMLALLPEAHPWLASVSLLPTLVVAGSILQSMDSPDVARAREVTNALLQRAIK